jgi:hypothetical protein
MNSILFSLLLLCEGPAIVFDNRPEMGVPPEALAQKSEKALTPEVPRTFHAITDGTIKAVRIRYFNEATWVAKDAAGEYVAGFLASDASGVFDFQIWSQSVGRPEIECVVEFSGDYLMKLRQENKPCRPEGRLLIWNTEACFRDADGRWRFVTAFDYFHRFHPKGDRKHAKPVMPRGGPACPVDDCEVAFANEVAETSVIRVGGSARNATLYPQEDPAAKASSLPYRN